MLKKYKKFKVACIQMNSQANIYDNILFAKNKIIYASKKGAKLVLLPENCFLMTTNKKQVQELSSIEEQHPGINEMKRIAKNLGIWIVIGSVNIREKKRIFNRSLLIDTQGRIKGRYNKIHLFSAKLPNKESYDETRYFVPGKKVCLLNLDESKNI